MLQATLTADVTYFFEVDGFNGAYGVWQFTLEALDNSTVEGSLLSGPYGLAVAGTSSTNTTSKLCAASSLVCISQRKLCVFMSHSLALLVCVFRSGSPILFNSIAQGSASSCNTCPNQKR